MKKQFYIIVSLFAVSACAMSYEYFLGAMASYLLGDGKVQWALTITAMMVSMGFGGYSSRYVTHHEKKVLQNELLIAFIGGFSTLVQYAIVVYFGIGQAITLIYIFINGFILGFQVPLFMHIIKKQGSSFKDTIANVTFFDFLGAIPAVLLYIFLIKEVGMVKGTMFVGLINIATVFLGLKIFKEDIDTSQRKAIFGLAIIVLVLLVGGISYGERAALGLEQKLYEYRIIHKEQSSFQMIIVTKEREDIRLFLNGNLQFSSQDEYRYHEALVHPTMSLAPYKNKVLILGGGDGLAVREILKYDEKVKEITLVDLDPAITDMAQTNPLITALNDNSLKDDKVEIINTDAMQFLQETTEIYDVIIIDLPDPNNEALTKLYTKEFYKLCNNRLAETGKLVTQSTSPYFCKEAFWTISNTIKSADFYVLPYHVYVPSFGDWGFNIASKNKIQKSKMDIEVETKYLNKEILANLFLFPKDEQMEVDEVNTLIRPIVLDMYLEAWRNW